jgi:hypothetical protein
VYDGSAGYLAGLELNSEELTKVGREGKEDEGRRAGVGEGWRTVAG